MAYEIWAFNNVDQVQAVLQSVVGVLGSADFFGAMKTMALAAFLITGAAIFMMVQKFESIMQWLLILSFFYFGLFIPKVPVQITDRTGVQPSVIVNNVPVGLAFFASSTSHLGAWMTGVTETVFSLPNDLKFQKNGMMFGSKLVQSGRTVAVDDPIFRMDLINYVKNCVNPDILDGYKSPATIRTSTNLWFDLGDANPGRWTVVGGGAQVLNCYVAYNFLTPYWNGQIDNQTTWLGRAMNSYQTNPVAAKALVMGQMPDAYSTILGISASATDIVQQNMMVNLMNDAAIAIPQLMGDPVAGQVALAKAQAQAQNATQYQVLGQIAEETLPMVRNVIELLIYGLFPFIFLFILVAGFKGLALLRSYVFALFFVQLWAPLYAILNYIGTIYASSKVQAAMMGSAGITLQNVDGVAAATMNETHIVGMLTMAIPAIAWGITKMGDMALGGAVSQVMAPASSAGAAAGAAAGAGNVNMGNASLNTTKANIDSQNKLDKDLSVAFGASKVQQADGSSWRQFADGSKTLSLPQNDTAGMAANIKSGVQTSLTAGAAKKLEHGQANVVAGQETQAAALGDMISRAKNRVNATEAAKGHTSDEVQRFTQGHAAASKVMQTLKSTAGVSDSDAADIVARGGLNLGVASAGGGMRYSSEQRKAIEKAIGGENADTWSKAKEYASGLTNSESFRNSVTSNRTRSESSSASFNKGVEQTRRGQSDLSESKNLSQQAQSVASGGYDAAFSMLSRKENSGLLSKLDKEVGKHLSAGNPQAALAAISEATQVRVAPGAPDPLPSKFGDGSAVPTNASLNADHAAKSKEIGEKYNPSAVNEGNKGVVTGGGTASSAGSAPRPPLPQEQPSGQTPQAPSVSSIGSWRAQATAAGRGFAAGAAGLEKGRVAQFDANAKAIAAIDRAADEHQNIPPIGRMANDAHKAGKAFKPKYEPHSNPNANHPGAEPGPLGSTFVPNSPKK